MWSDPHDLLFSFFIASDTWKGLIQIYNVHNVYFNLGIWGCVLWQDKKKKRRKVQQNLRKSLLFLKPYEHGPG